MKFLATLLYALAACAALLVGTGLWIDAPRSEMRSTGLTAAAILGTDATVPTVGATGVGVTVGIQG